MYLRSIYSADPNNGHRLFSANPHRKKVQNPDFSRDADRSRWREGFWGVFWHLTSQVTNLEKQKRNRQLHKEDHRIPGWITPTSLAHVYIVIYNTLPHRSLPSLCISLWSLFSFFNRHLSGELGLYHGGGTTFAAVLGREQVLERGFRRDRNRVHSRYLRGLTGTTSVYHLTPPTPLLRNQEKVWSNNSLFLCADLSRPRLINTVTLVVTPLSIAF